MKCVTLLLLAGLTYLGSAQVPEGKLIESQGAGAWLTGTYWYVPSSYLPAQLAVTMGPRILTASDQTVWHFTGYSRGYLHGIAATNIGLGWNYSLIVGSVTPDGAVKLSFSPLANRNPDDPTTQSITIGDGVLRRTGERSTFTMQMTSGTSSVSLTHWAMMFPVTPRDPEWRSLPGYPDTGVGDLPGLNTPIHTQ